MAWTDNAHFKEWLERRLSDEPGERTEQRAATECTQCAGPLRDDDIPGDTCPTCLALHYGGDLVEECFGEAFRCLVVVALEKGGREVGRLLAEGAQSICDAAEYVLLESAGDPVGDVSPESGSDAIKRVLGDFTGDPADGVSPRTAG